jgi:hypothetical protein
VLSAFSTLFVLPVLTVLFGGSDFSFTTPVIPDTNTDKCRQVRHAIRQIPTSGLQITPGPEAGLIIPDKP